MASVLYKVELLGLELDAMANNADHAETRTAARQASVQRGARGVQEGCHPCTGGRAWLGGCVAKGHTSISQGNTVTLGGLDSPSPTPPQVPQVALLALSLW